MNVAKKDRLIDILEDTMSLHEYANYIVESKINGNYTQVDELIEEACNADKSSLSAIVYEFSRMEDSEDVRYCANIAIKKLVI